MDMDEGDIETLLELDPPPVKEAWQMTEGWYKADAERAPKLSQITIKRIMV